MCSPSPRQALIAPAADGYPIACSAWRWASGSRERPVVVVCPATSVRARYYERFAQYLHAKGFDVVTFDYRGIGGSRPASLSGFRASAIDWGLLDLEAVLAMVRERFPGQPVDAVAHSIGGLVLGLAPSNAMFRRVFTVGAQYAYWRDYAPRARWCMALKWHLLMPLVTALCGYFPGKRLGWMEDTPAGVVRDWSRRSRRFEASCHSACRTLGAADRVALASGFARVRAPLLALSFRDDPFATVPAVERLLAYFTGGTRSHLRLDATHFGAASVGHFGFFDEAFRETLWPLARAWLLDANVDRAAERVLEPRIRAVGWMSGPGQRMTPSDNPSAAGPTRAMCRATRGMKPCAPCP